jgi:hypothetical protein
MKHKHHIIPKHMGGTDEPSNLVELTVEEHAEAHKVLYEIYGKKEDWLAWQGLAKLISKKDILKQMCSHIGEKNGMYGVVGEKNPLFGKKRTEETKLKIKTALKKHKRTDEHQSKLNNRFTKEYIKNVTNSISRNWKIITPEGKTFIIKNMAEFCRKNNLTRSGMSNASKNGVTHKGYKCQKVGT